jgi:hypothetical protein
MRIIIEIPDDQVPPSYRSDLYPSGYAEDNLHDLIISDSILRKLEMKMDLIIAKDIGEELKQALKETYEADIALLKLLQQNMKIESESGVSKEKILIDGLTDVVKDWYDGCPKSMNFVTRTLKLLKTYMGNPKC